MDRSAQADRMETSRRSVIRGLGGGAMVTIAGCSGNPGSGGGDVVVGPDGRLVFEPEELTVQVDETVSWYFDSAGHNVSARPDDSELARLPDGAAPFSSYDADGSAMSLVSPGETYEHRFEVPGEYEYVCVPHVAAGMIGRVTVEA